MTSKVKKIMKVLDELIGDPKIPLTYKNEFTFLVAVLLSQQCTDARVNQITPLLFKKAKTPKEMIALGETEIEKIIRPVGLAKTKSKHLVALSKILVEKFDSKIPQTFDELLSLPGVGRKTASVVMSQAFNEDAFAVDTHVHRLAKRWGLSSGKSRDQTEKDLKKAFPKKSWSKVHLQMIYFGRTFCQAKKHDLKTCPICSMCILGSIEDTSP